MLTHWSANIKNNDELIATHLSTFTSSFRYWKSVVFTRGNTPPHVPSSQPYRHTYCAIYSSPCDLPSASPHIVCVFTMVIENIVQSTVSSSPILTIVSLFIWKIAATHGLPSTRIHWVIYLFYPMWIWPKKVHLDSTVCCSAHLRTQHLSHPDIRDP